MRASHDCDIETLAERSFHDLMPQLRKLVAEAGVRQGWMIISAMHTTGAIIVNENEPRLLEDIENVLDRLVPKHDDYLHNDIFARTMPDKPRNAHAHIASMLLGGCHLYKAHWLWVPGSRYCLSNHYLGIGWWQFICT
ncbi:MAG TPA: YjbQ family protein [Nitrosomonas halophila]|nr:YjbQ family protein [Nitrosomonas halophila]